MCRYGEIKLALALEIGRRFVTNKYQKTKCNADEKMLHYRILNANVALKHPILTLPFSPFHLFSPLSLSRLLGRIYRRRDIFYYSQSGMKKHLYIKVLWEYMKIVVLSSEHLDQTRAFGKSVFPTNLIEVMFFRSDYCLHVIRNSEFLFITTTLSPTIINSRSRQ